MLTPIFVKNYESWLAVDIVIAIITASPDRTAWYRNHRITLGGKIKRYYHFDKMTLTPTSRYNVMLNFLSATCLNVYKQTLQP